MASVSPHYRMADRLAGGRLAEILLEYKRAGHKPDYIGRLLFADFGIEAHRNTVEVWTDLAEKDQADAEAAM